MLQKTAKVLLLQLNEESNNYGNEAPPLRSAGLSFLFTLCRSECILLLQTSQGCDYEPAS